MDTLPTKYGYKIPEIKISNEDQERIINHMVSLIDDSLVVANKFGTKAEAYEDFWYTLHLREMYDSAGIKISGKTYIDRVNHNVDWRWKNDEFTLYVKSLIDPIEKFYKTLTRVFVLLQVPGKELPLHQDDAIKYAEHQEQNKFLALKLPLSLNRNSPGKPVVFIDNQLYTLNSENCLYALNEMEMLHGALPCEHHRGVIFIDGILNTEELNKVSKTNIGLKKSNERMSIYDKYENLKDVYKFS